MTDNINETRTIAALATRHDINISPKIRREDIEEYIDPYQDNIDLLFKKVRKSRRKMNPTYGGWKRKRMFR